MDEGKLIITVVSTKLHGIKELHVLQLIEK